MFWSKVLSHVSRILTTTKAFEALDNLANLLLNDIYKNISSHVSFWLPNDIPRLMLSSEDKVLIYATKQLLQWKTLSLQLSDGRTGWHTHEYDLIADWKHFMNDFSLKQNRREHSGILLIQNGKRRIPVRWRDKRKAES